MITEAVRESEKVMRITGPVEAVGNELSQAMKCADEVMAKEGLYPASCRFETNNRILTYWETYR